MEDRRGSQAGRRVEDRSVGSRIAELTSAIGQLDHTIASMATKEDVKDSEDRQDARRRRGLMVLGGFMAVLVLLMAGLGWVVWSQRDLIDQGREISLQNRENGELLIECLTPSVDEDNRHECFEIGQAADDVIGVAITLAIFDAVTCAQRPQPLSTLATCYADRIEARTGVRPRVEGQ